MKRKPYIGKAFGTYQCGTAEKDLSKDEEKRINVTNNTIKRRQPQESASNFWGNLKRLCLGFSATLH